MNNMQMMMISTGITGLGETTPSIETSNIKESSFSEEVSANRESPPKIQQEDTHINHEGFILFTSIITAMIIMLIIDAK